MKDHYVSYSQAVKLKELGFDWKCDKFYVNNWQSKLSYIPYQVQLFTKEQADAIAQNLDDTIIYPVPTLSVAQKWLREAKGIDIEINAYQHLDGKSVKHQYNFGVLTINGETFANTWYNNYEQALSDAIDTTLELLGKEEKE